jgi:hypothetical protein
MPFRFVKARWLIVPFTAFLLLSSGGAAVAPDCHIESAAPTKNSSAVAHNHSAVGHNHSHQSSSSALLNAAEIPVAAGGSLNNEICFVVGFIVLLLLRFSQITRTSFTTSRIPRSRYLLPFSLPVNLGYLNLTHLKLGIIRI